MDTSSFVSVPATGNALLVATVGNFAAINDHLTSELVAARMEISRLGELLKSYAGAAEAAVVTHTEKHHKPKPKNYKTVLCTHFEKGTCTRGDKCHFAHGVDEIREIPEN